MLASYTEAVYRNCSFSDKLLTVAWSRNIKEVTDEFPGVMLGVRPRTEFAS